MSKESHAIVTTPAVGIVPERMSPVVSQGMRILEASSVPDPAALRELLALQREWEHEEARKAFEAAMVRMKAALPTVLSRDKRVKFESSKGTVNYTHTSLAAAMEAVTPHLTEHGFSLAWTPATAQGQVSVTCVLTHVSGHSKSATINAPVDQSGSKSAAQGVASTITLLQRYTALSLLGIATADMKDPEPAAPEPDAPNADRALRMVGWLGKKQIPREEAEAYLEKKVADWTNADIEALGKWAQERKG